MRVLLFSISIVLLSCSSNSGKVEVIRSNESSESVDSLRSPFHEAYYTDVSTETLAELIMSDSVPIYDQGSTWRVVEMILSESQENRDHYFPAFLYIMDNSDGAVSESMGGYAKEYMESYPEEFFERFECCQDPDAPSCEVALNFAEYLAREMRISMDTGESIDDLLGRLDSLKQEFPDRFVIQMVVDSVTNNTKN